MLSQSEKVKLILANKTKIEELAKQNRKAMGVVDSEDEEERPKKKKQRSIFSFDIDAVEIRKQEMLKKYPWAAA